MLITGLQWLRAQHGVQLIRTGTAATEACALLARRVGNPAALDFLRWAQRAGFTLDRAEDHALAEVLLISERFADLPSGLQFDLADASIAEAAGRLKIRQILTINADFDVYLGRDGKPLIKVLRPA